MGISCLCTGTDRENIKHKQNSETLLYLYKLSLIKHLSYEMIADFLSVLHVFAPLKCEYTWAMILKLHEIVLFACSALVYLINRFLYTAGDFKNH